MQMHRVMVICFVVSAVVTWGVTPASAQTQTGQISSVEVQKILSQPVNPSTLREKSRSPAIQDRLKQSRALLESRGGKSSLGYTSAMELPIEALAGTRIPKPEPRIAAAIQARALALAKLEEETAQRLKIDISRLASAQCNPNSAAFDWRKSGK